MSYTPVDPATVHTAAYKTDTTNKCPRCLGDGNRWAGPLYELAEHGMGRQVARRCACHVCGLRWTEVYKMAYITNIEEVA